VKPSPFPWCFVERNEKETQEMVVTADPNLLVTIRQFGKIGSTKSNAGFESEYTAVIKPNAMFFREIL
jgi:hypothetical protein